ncbi:MBL fold metallo-hydrolase [Caproiciproducens galactitolivorans]|uniref:Ribonuclease n=1 Tax=Caproiciproducens galactitolivorans TaxID=642589 RepID=A0A4Z0YF92_9FIRM|nr:MBL fold metallo-hydrolase [Caproiciproducens galactitolivorans]QEY33798.1 MBL fold metallo-hydrolase [Caproiciproducens galactitolivorans]TGJ75622.1 ribonuclease [Caproiciproducens galactitolivorans]
MQLIFYGAAHEVTGSCYCLMVNGKKILIDCGLQQGADEDDNHKLPFYASQIDYVIVTHAHIDHSGRLPLLVKNGYQGKIYASGITCKLLSIMLRDSAHIQEMDVVNENRKGKRAGREPEEPIYTLEDAQDTLERLVPYSYGEMVELCEGVRFRFIDAGHLLGSASVEMWMTENGRTKKIVFSGDIGNVDQPIIRDPQYIEQADYVVMESTYGDRDHEKAQDYVALLADIFEKTLSAGGNVVIPSFAVGRTQELLYYIREMKERGLVKCNPDFPVYVDSPLAAEATKIYSGDLTGYADDETVEVIQSGFHPISFSNLNICVSVEESKALNMDGVPKVILSSSGMCEAGRIRHHLKHNLWRPECAVVFVGYQANGTLGRLLLDGAKRVKLFGEEIAVQSHIYNFRGLSAHADRTGLLNWIQAFQKKPKRVFVVHGEAGVCDLFCSSLRQLGYDALVPNFQTVFDLAENQILEDGIAPETRRTQKAGKGKKYSAAFARLVEAGQRLLQVIQKNEGSANKDIAKFADQVLSLCNKWDR